MDLLFLIIIPVLIFAVFIITFKLLKVSFEKIIIGVTGLISGLIVSTLLNTAVSKIPGELGYFLPLVISVLFGIAGIFIFIAREKVISGFFQNIYKNFKPLKSGEILKSEIKINEFKDLIIDTSVIIDGRIEDILKTGFILGKLIIPKAVIGELHKISDSRDHLKRSRGRRGLEILNNIQKMKVIESEIIEDDFPDVKEVDQKLINIAKKRKGYILTVDYNLNKVAQIHKVIVLNINELANALRAIILPGEKLDIKVIQEGKEKNQGVGYLPDGTMVVIEGGNKYIGDTVEAEVSRIFQTVAGRMIFAEPKEVKK